LRVAKLLRVAYIKFCQESEGGNLPVLKKGMLVAIEGIDGTGKSTEVQKLCMHFTRLGFKTRCLREPTVGRYGMEIRRIAREGRHLITPEEELELFIQDRIEDCEKNIRPALSNRELVLIDRYYFSTIAYQGALGLDQESIRQRNETIAVIPDLVIILDMAVDRSLARIRERGDVQDDFERSDFLERVRLIFQSMNFPYVIIIDADRQPEKVFNDLLVFINRLIEENREG
jgi:dTMP kinase